MLEERERERKKEKIVRLMHRRIFPTVSKKLFGFRLLCFSLDRLKILAPSSRNHGSDGSNC